MPSTLAAPSAVRPRLSLILVCLAALCEGADIVSMGLAAPRLVPSMGLGPDQIGVALTAAVVGLMGGASVGGWLSDRAGRKTVLILAMAILSVFSLATTLASGYPQLVVFRFLTGLGLGAAFPCLIGIAAGAGATPSTLRISIMYSCQPLGGVFLAGTIAVLGAAAGWKAVFYIGGLAPLILLPFLFLLPDDRKTRPDAVIVRDPRMNLLKVLFGEGRGTATVLLWVAYACTLAILFIINSWLPSLAVGLGLTRDQASGISAIENLGAAVGSLTIGWLIDRWNRAGVIVLTYLGMAFALVGLACFSGFTMIAASAALLGFFVVGGQLILYALTPAYYPSAVRGSGVGMAVAVGRVGAIGGPLIVGNMISAGAGSSVVLAVAAPAIFIAGLVAAALVLIKPSGLAPAQRP